MTPVEFLTVVLCIAGAFCAAEIVANFLERFEHDRDR